MGKLIALDDGHGMETAGKRTPAFPDGTVMRENEFNATVVKYLAAELKGNGFDVIEVAPEITDTALATRVQRANAAKADAYIAVHANAYGNDWNDANGVETWIYSGVKDGSETHRGGRIIQKHIAAATGLRDRGLKRSETLYVLNSTKMHAFLPELGFMTNMQEATLMRSDEYRKTCATAICKAMCEFFGADAKPGTQAGTQELKLTAIEGQAVATVRQMVDYLLKCNPTPRLPYCTACELAEMFLIEGKAENIRGDVAWCQSLKETGNFNYGNIVNPDQNNYAGIGALNDNANGQCAAFETPLIGVRAQIQHLKAYANKLPLINECVDPRFSKVSRGTAPYVEWLGAADNPNGFGWAVPGAGYGSSVLNILAGILKMEVDGEAKNEVPAWQTNGLQILIDAGVIGDADYWKNRMQKNLTGGEVFGLLGGTINVSKSVDWFFRK